MSDYHNQMTDFLEQYQMVRQSKSVAPLYRHQLLDQIDFTSALPHTLTTSKDFLPEYISLLKDHIDTLPESLPEIDETHLPAEAAEHYMRYLDIRFKRLPLLPELVTSYSYQDIFINYLDKGVDSPKRLLTTLKRRKTILCKKLRYRALLEAYLLYLSTVFMRLSTPASPYPSKLFENEEYVRKLVNDQISALGFLPV